MRALRATAGALLVCCLLLGVAPGARSAAVPARRAGAVADPAGRALRSLGHTLTVDLRSAGGNGSADVVDLTTGQTLFSVAADAPRLPASVEKLYTTSTALLEYGPTATLETAVLGTGSLAAGGVWRGTLYLRGGGDPTFGSAAFDHAAYGTGATAEDLAAAVRAAGIRRVAGPIVGDGTLFDALRGTPATGFAPNLELEGQLGGLIYDAGFTTAAENALQPRPATFATLAFIAALRADGIRVPAATPVYAGAAPPNASLVAEVPSPPMSTLIELTNAPSDNYFAETLLKDLGAGFGAGGTTAAGAKVVETTIEATYHLQVRTDDGSGLSRFDRTTASQVVSLLEQQASDQPFVDSLAIAGVDGTMQHEMLGTPAVGNCRGKTGTLSDVANLAGYCTARNGDLLAFAFLENSIGNADAGHLTEDAMGAKLAEYDPLTGAG